MIVIAIYWGGSTKWGGTSKWGSSAGSRYAGESISISENITMSLQVISTTGISISVIDTSAVNDNIKFPESDIDINVHEIISTVEYISIPRYAATISVSDTVVVGDSTSRKKTQNTRYSAYTNTVRSSAVALVAPAEDQDGYKVLLYNANGSLVTDLGYTTNVHCQFSELTIIDKLNELDEIEITLPRHLITVSGEQYTKHTLAGVEYILMVIRQSDGKSSLYRIKSKDDDLEAEVRLSGKSLAFELSEYFTNETAGGSTFYGYTPSEIVNDILNGKKHISLNNPRFGSTDAMLQPISWNYTGLWRSGINSRGEPVWIAPAGSSPWENFSWSEKKECNPLASYEITVRMEPETPTQSGEAWLIVGFYDQEYRSVGVWGTQHTTHLAVESKMQFTIQAPQDARFIGIGIGAFNIDYGVRFTDVRIYERIDASPWTYQAVENSNGDSVEKRNINLYANNGELKYHPGITWSGIVPTGNWDGTGYNWDAPSASRIICSNVGSTVECLAISSYVWVDFDSAYYGNVSISVINGAHKKEVYSSLNTQMNNSVKINLDPGRRSHIEVKVISGTVGFKRFRTDSTNSLHMEFNESTVLNVLTSIKEAVGGETEYDTATRTIKHHIKRGTDWTVIDGGPTFMRETNLPKLTKLEESTDIVNRLIFEGYGDAKKLLIVVDADERKLINGVMQRSQDVYGVRRGVYTDKSVKDDAIAKQMGRKIVNKNAWPKVTYTTEVYDNSIRDGILSVGDTCRFIYNEEDVNLRILEIHKDGFDTKRATLIVGDPVDSLQETIANIQKDLKGIASTPQGALIPQTLLFTEDFDTSYSAIFPFDVFYGQEFEQLLLTYNIERMRSTVRGVNTGGESLVTTPEGGGRYGTTESGNLYTTDPIGSNVTFGGDHEHDVMFFAGGYASPSFTNVATFAAKLHIPGGATWMDTYIKTAGAPDAYGSPVSIATYNGGNHTHSMSHQHSIPSHAHNYNIPSHNHSFNIPSHNHPMQYGIFVAAATPTRIDVYLDNILITATSGMSINSLDIKQYLSVDSSGMPTVGQHVLEFRFPSPNPNATTVARVKGRLFMVSYISSRLR